MRYLSLLALVFSLLGCNQAGDSNKSSANLAFADEAYADMFQKIYKHSLSEGQAYENLRELCKDVGHRLSGSENAQKAVDWGFDKMTSYGLESVWKQPCMVTHWERGENESCFMLRNEEQTQLSVLALGGSIATPSEGIQAEVVEVKTFEELASLGKEKVEGKIVFFNRPMNEKLVNTFHAYGGCVDQRSSGAKEAAPLGALAVLVRSMNLRIDDYPHTGVMRYEDGITKIPAAALSTLAAENLSNALASDPNLEVSLKMNCQSFPDAPSFNVIGEIKGAEFPDEILLVGGHLDSWDVGEGAHDDGAGSVQSIEVLRIMKAIGYKPKRTIRAVLYMNEENGAKGAAAYADIALQNNEKHIAAVESDRGGFSPRGFNIQGNDKAVTHFKEYSKLFEPYYSDRLVAGYGGVDIGFLKDHGTLLIGFEPDPQRYFIHHHAATDVFENVDERELELGAAAITSMLYLIDQQGVNF